MSNRNDGSEVIAGVIFGCLILLVACLVWLVQLFFSDSISDFETAKANETSIECNGFVKKQIYTHNMYTVKNDVIVVKKLMKDKIYKPSDCSVL